MTNVITVRAVTVTQTDYDANIDKFYTTYEVGPFEIRQWGRVGVIGQFSIQKHSVAGVAGASARQQISKKQSGGYTDWHDVTTFQFDIDKLGQTPGKEQAKWVAHAKDASMAAVRGTGRSPVRPAAASTPVQTVQTTDRFEDFTARALSAITLAVTDPPKAGVVYATLNQEWTELQAVTEKAMSYLSTLDSLLNASMS